MKILLIGLHAIGLLYLSYIYLPIDLDIILGYYVVLMSSIGFMSLCEFLQKQVQKANNVNKCIGISGLSLISLFAVIGCGAVFTSINSLILLVLLSPLMVVLIPSILQLMEELKHR